MMPKNNRPEDNIDWSLTTWEGSRRESLRRWAQLPLENIIAALEEMQEISEALATTPAKANVAVQEQQSKYYNKIGAAEEASIRRGNDSDR